MPPTDDVDLLVIGGGMAEVIRLQLAQPEAAAPAAAGAG